jgi:hypothetical protein
MNVNKMQLESDSFDYIVDFFGLEYNVNPI